MFLAFITLALGFIPNLYKIEGIKRFGFFALIPFALGIERRV